MSHGVPLVSLLILCYNQVDLVAAALQSALDQDYPNLEIVVADDGSTDGTAEVVLDAASRNPGRVRPLLGRENVGITRNANRGLRQCRGEYFAWMGGDDVLYPEKITAQVRWLQQDPGRVLCGHDVDVFDLIRHRHICRWSERVPMTAGRGAAAIVRQGIPCAASSIMIPVSALPAGGFDERLPIVSDWKLYIDVLADGGAYGYVEGVHGQLGRHERNITKTAFEQRFDDTFCTLALVESAYPQLCGAVRASRALRLYEKAKWHLGRGERAEARWYARAALRPFGAVGWHAYAVLAATYSERLRTTVLRHFTPWY